MPLYPSTAPATDKPTSVDSIKFKYIIVAQVHSSFCIFDQSISMFHNRQRILSIWFTNEIFSIAKYSVTSLPEYTIFSIQLT